MLESGKEKMLTTFIPALHPAECFTTFTALVEKWRKLKSGWMKVYTASDS